MQKLVDAYLTDGTINMAIQATPGRKVNFLGSHAEIYYDADMPAVLSMPNVIVVVDRERVEWLPEWLAATRNVAAEIRLPDGYELDCGRLVTKERSSGKDGARANKGAGKQTR